MGYIKEPEGVDFVIKSELLSDLDKKEISNFIRDYKEKAKSKKTQSTNIRYHKKMISNKENA